ncbi:hypothetical protein [Microbacterium sp. SLBN-146]|uniref:hypothetical protein n=1 Tax=Microbacterium sp. SLBN-146 TaxID=2768457 RepID=UPI001150459E|nr:hypothetical protein [Microbacterium sp. SLBN-146]TQJ30257.1 hypothetical protein FBY39_0703 [Microbacterium sp. SLBN-146]
MTTENAPHTPPQRPLGSWLRVVDGLISAEFAEAFAAEGIDRRDWMLLSVMAGEADVPPFAAKLARRGKRLRRLEERGWASEQSDGTWTLTDEGRQAKERLGAILDGIRQRVAGAVSPEDFATTMASLEAIARELGGDDPDAHAWRGGRGFGRRFGHRGAPRFEHDGPGPFGPGPFGPGPFGPRHRRGHAPFGHDDFDVSDGRRFRPGPHGRRCRSEHAHGRPEHATEHAYERGFEAGLAHGRSA